MDTTQSQLKTINCTECSAPLDLKGGRQVKSISCPYCGAVLDNKDEYKVVEHFLSADRPKTLLRVGLEGVLKDVKFIIIGFIGYESEGDKWIEYQLFSPTHGYAWLSYADNKYVFGHKVRYYPKSYSKQKYSTFRLNNKSFKVMETYTARIDFVEGELTWIARKNDEVTILEATFATETYSIETSKQEQEYSLGKSLSVAVVYKAFGLPPPQMTSPSSFTNKSSDGLKVKEIVFIVFMIAFIGIINFLQDGSSSSYSSSSVRSGSARSSSYSSSSYSGGK